MERCNLCYCTPCIVVIGEKQTWMLPRQEPSAINRTLRKDIYFRFWGLISNAGGFTATEYLGKKQESLNVAGASATKVRREIMPDCVLTFVRERYPNPPGIPYVGHKWK